MNRTMNDRGQTVYCVGAPGSEARIAVEWPSLIATLETYRHAEWDDWSGVAAAFDERRISAEDAETVLTLARYPSDTKSRILSELRRRRRVADLAREVAQGGEE